jgi:hypothetical protein
METEKNFINWSAVSEKLTNKKANISKTRIPSQHKDKVDALLKKVSQWLKGIE